MNREQYIAQVTLLLDCLPALADQNIFALKGGTAINFFIQDLPRLSVDIDLTFVSTEQREQALGAIAEGLNALKKSIARRNRRYQIRDLTTQEGNLKKLIVSDGATKIKIEPNVIMRGTLLPTIKMNIKKEVEDRFAYSVKHIPILAEAELYAGKICAALSRQHPRDFFDIKKLIETQGITDGMRQAFVVYLVCSPRPIHELLRPRLIVLKNIYESELVNMTEAPVSLEELLDTREKLIKTINQGLSNNERNFILSVKQGQPDYSLMPFDNLDQLPALKWKITNVRRMNKQKHIVMLNKLSEILEI